MKKRRILIIISGCLAAALIGPLLSPREREPEYNGVPLSAWLERATPREDFIRAIKHIGTNGLPILVRSVDYKLPWWRFWLSYKIAPQLPKGPLRSLLSDKPLQRANAALLAFEILGRDARPALEDLRRIAGSSDPSTFAGHAILTLTSSMPGDFDPF